ncbi:MAG: hypothetical protein NVSMB31_15440 [Vulcanimicrobiaceae bacterium]
MKIIVSWLLVVACFSLALRGSGIAAASPTGVALSHKESANCNALAPDDWTLSSNPQSSTLDAESADHTMYAGWGVVQINRTMQQDYGPMYGPPELSIQTLAGMVLRSKFGDPSGMRYTTSPRPFLKFFEMRGFSSQQTHGVVFYHIYPAADPNSYIESLYLAISRNAVPRSKRAIAQAVAVSIRCRTQLVYHAPEAGRGRPGKHDSSGCSAEGTLRGYNKELGWQYAHTTSGTNKLFDNNDWRENGPQGAGYYATVGNSLEKLELGRSDDC